ncbi:putative transglutaminase-like cysteine proteinase [Amorphus suaedae]
MKPIKRNALTWLAAPYLACALAAPTPSLAEANRFMPLATETEAPDGFVDFCTRFPVDCQESGEPARAVVLTRDRWVELVETNRSVNRTVSPTTDQEFYGREEFWTFPQTAGDCEDYVLLKRHKLIGKGWPSSVLLITVVRDENGEGHAVLTVGTDRGDLILDNRTDVILPWNNRPYTYVKRQRIRNPRAWVRVLDPRATQAVGSLRPPADAVPHARD